MSITKNTESISIVVQWDEMDDSLSTTYTVTWTDESNHMLHSFTEEEISSYTITGLTLDTVYTITVSATNKCGTGPEYRTSVSLSTDTISSSTSTTTAIINTMAITSTASSSISTTMAKSSTITITTNNPMMNPSTTTTTETTNVKTGSTNPIVVITSTYSASDIMSPISTINPSTADENGKVLGT